MTSKGIRARQQINRPCFAIQKYMIDQYKKYSVAIIIFDANTLLPNVEKHCCQRRFFFTCYLFYGDLFLDNDNRAFFVFPNVESPIFSAATCSNQMTIYNNREINTKQCCLFSHRHKLTQK